MSILPQNEQANHKNFVFCQNVIRKSTKTGEVSLPELAKELKLLQKQFEKLFTALTPT